MIIDTRKGKNEIMMFYLKTNSLSHKDKWNSTIYYRIRNMATKKNGAISWFYQEKWT